MKVWQIALGVVVAVGLVFGVVLPGLAAPDEPGPAEVKLPFKMLKGSVVSLDENQEFFVIEAKDDEIKILVGEETKYFNVPFPRQLVSTIRNRLGRMTPQLENAECPNPPCSATQKSFPGRGQGFGKLFQLRNAECLNQPPSATEGTPLGLQAGVLNRARPFGEEASYDDLKIDDKVVVHVVPGEDEPLAKVVLIIEAKSYSQIEGTISAVSTEDKTITITPSDGAAEITLSYGDRTRFQLVGLIEVEAGQSVRVIYNDDLEAQVVFINPNNE